MNFIAATAVVPAPTHNVSPGDLLHQMRQLLDANGVRRPHVMWLTGEYLVPLLKRIGKIAHYKDGPIKPQQLYKYNLDYNRFYEAEPWKPTW